MQNIKHTVSQRCFIKELTQEVKELDQFGTTYRKVTAQLALEVAKTSITPYLFFEREDAYNKVSRQYAFDKYDLERKKDVSEMLYHIIRDLDRKSKLTTEYKKELEYRKQQMKLINLKLNSTNSKNSNQCYKTLHTK